MVLRKAQPTGTRQSERRFTLRSSWWTVRPFTELMVPVGSAPCDR